ncbi:hypothetical protein COBT_001539 [Conglomerata obtusa]
MEFFAFFIISRAYELEQLTKLDSWYGEGLNLELGNYTEENMLEFENNLLFAVIQTQNQDNDNLLDIEQFYRLIDIEIGKFLGDDVIRKDHNQQYTCMMQKNSLNLVLNSFIGSVMSKFLNQNSSHDYNFFFDSIRKYVNLYNSSKAFTNNDNNFVQSEVLNLDLFLRQYEDNLLNHDQDNFMHLVRLLDPLFKLIEKEKLKIKKILIFSIKHDDKYVHKKLEEFVKTTISAYTYKQKDLYLFYPCYKIDYNIAYCMDTDSLTYKYYNIFFLDEFVGNEISEIDFLKIDYFQNQNQSNYKLKNKQLNCRLIGNERGFFTITDYQDIFFNNRKYQFVQNYELLYVSSSITNITLKTLSYGWCSCKNQQITCKIIISDKMDKKSKFHFKRKLSSEKRKWELEVESYFYSRNVDDIHKRYCNIKKLCMLYVYNEIDVMNGILNTSYDYRFEFDEINGMLHTKTSLFKFLYYSLSEYDRSIILDKDISFLSCKISFIDFNAPKTYLDYSINKNTILHLIFGTTGDYITYQPISIETNNFEFNMLFNDDESLNIGKNYFTSIEICNKIFREYFYNMNFADRQKKTFEGYLSFFFQFVISPKKDNTIDVSDVNINILNAGLDYNSILLSVRYLSLYETIYSQLNITDFIDMLFSSNVRSEYFLEHSFIYFNFPEDAYDEDSLQAIIDEIQSNNFTYENINNIINAYQNEQIDIINHDRIKNLIHAFYELEQIVANANKKIWEIVLASNFEFIF